MVKGLNLLDWLYTMGANGSKLEKALGDQFPEGERYYGFENFGNTCYCNSVLQALYVCVPFRRQLLEHYSTTKGIGEPEENLLNCLGDLFTQINSQKRKTGSVAPRRFVNRLKKQNELFRSYMHQGIVTNETKCLQCETVTARDETYLDLSVDIEENSSITNCLKNFSSTETLNGNDKFFCDKCCSLQEAQKRMKIKKLPQILVIHLKRFKYIEHLGRYKKLSYQIVFPLELKLSNTAEDSDIEYSLFGVVVHVGSGPNHGHYVSLMKSHNHWLYFDDENVEMIEEHSVQTFFGSAKEYSSNTDHGYIMFYESLAPKDK